MTSDVTTDLVLLIYLAVIGSLIGMPLIVAFRQVRLERRRIMAGGTQAPGQITAEAAAASTRVAFATGSQSARSFSSCSA